MLWTIEGLTISTHPDTITLLSSKKKLLKRNPHLTSTSNSLMYQYDYVLIWRRRWITWGVGGFWHGRVDVLSHSEVIWHLHKQHNAYCCCCWCSPPPPPPPPPYTYTYKQHTHQCQQWTITCLTIYSHCIRKSTKFALKKNSQQPEVVPLQNNFVCVFFGETLQFICHPGVCANI